MYIIKKLQIIKGFINYKPIIILKNMYDVFKKMNNFKE